MGMPVVVFFQCLEGGNPAVWQLQAYVPVKSLIDLSKYIASLLSPLAGKTDSYVKDSEHLIEFVKVYV